MGWLVTTTTATGALSRGFWVSQGVFVVIQQMHSGAHILGLGHSIGVPRLAVGNPHIPPLTSAAGARLSDCEVLLPSRAPEGPVWPPSGQHQRGAHAEVLAPRCRVASNVQATDGPG